MPVDNKKHFWITLIYSVGQISLAAQNASEKLLPSYSITAKGSISIDREGNVVDFRLPSEKITPDIAKILGDSIKNGDLNLSLSMESL